MIGVERDPDHLREAARRYPWLTVVEGDASALPFEDGSVDAVVMLDVLEHVPEPRAVLTEVRRVLRPGGVVVLSVPHRGLLAPLDSLNVYPALQRRFRSWQPVEPADERGRRGTSTSPPPRYASCSAPGSRSSAPREPASASPSWCTSGCSSRSGGC